MRKSDKLKNFKKINLIVENRYLESKGIVPESSYNADGDEFNNLRGIADYGESEKTMAFRNVIDALKKIKNGAQPNEVNVGDALRRFKQYASEDEFQRVSNEYNNIVTSHGSHIGMDESNHSITEYGQSKQFDLRDEQNMDSLISMIVSYLGKEKTNDASIANDNKVIVYTELLRKLMLMSPPSTLNNGENGNEIYTNNPEAMRNYLNKFKVGGDFKFIDSKNTPYDNVAEINDMGLDEGEEIGNDFWSMHNTSAQEQKQICWNMTQHFKGFDNALNQNIKMREEALSKGDEYSDEVKILNFRIQYMENNRDMLDTPTNPFFKR